MHLRSDECDVSDFRHRRYRVLRHVVDLWHLGYNFLWLFSYSYYGINLLEPIHKMDQFDTCLYLLDLRCCYVLPMCAQWMRNQNQLRIDCNNGKNKSQISILQENKNVNMFFFSLFFFTCGGFSQPLPSIGGWWYCARRWWPSLWLLLLRLMWLLML